MRRPVSVRGSGWCVRTQGRDTRAEYRDEAIRPAGLEVIT